MENEPKVRRLRLYSENPPNPDMYYNPDKDNALGFLIIAVLSLMEAFIPSDDPLFGSPFVFDSKFLIVRLPCLLASVFYFFISYREIRNIKSFKKKWETVNHSFTYIHSFGSCSYAVDVQVELARRQAKRKICTALLKCAEDSVSKALHSYDSIPSREVLLRAIIPAMARKQWDLLLYILNVEITDIRETKGLQERMAPSPLGEVSTLPEDHY